MKLTILLCLLLVGCSEPQHTKQQTYRPGCTEVKQGKVIGYIVELGTGEWLPCREYKEK